MANRAKLITVDQSNILTIAKNVVIESIALCAAAATSTLEIFEGAIGTIATAAIGAAGTGYTQGDTITLVQAGGGVQAVFTVATEIAGVPQTLTLVSGGTGYVASSTYATTGGTGTGLTITASTVTDAGTSRGKISCVANTSQELELCTLFTDIVSLRITGSSAKGYMYHE